MPIAEQSKVFNNFTGGLNTESTGLNFPENAAEELDNFDLFRTGEVKRRLGVDFESGYALSSELFPISTFETSGISTHEWRAVNGSGELNFLAIQVGLKIFFHDLGSEPISGTLLGTVDLESVRTGSSAETFLIDASFGEGRMVITNRELEPSYIEYDDETTTFTLKGIQLRIRDFDGVDDGLQTATRPPTLSQEHHYNLLNQGWPTALRCANNSNGAGGTTVRDPIQFFFEQTFPAGYPSNSDIVHLGKLGAATDPEPIGTFHPTVIQKLVLGDTPASKGHFILNPFNRDRSELTIDDGSPSPFILVPRAFGILAPVPITSTTIDFSNLTAEVDTLRPTSTEFYAGRVWYGGAAGPENSGDLFFSQVITDMSEAGKCYQEADPTAESINSLVDSDGGVIHVAGMGTVQRMIAMGQDLVIIASNGTWAVSGPTGGNFTATDFTIRRINDIGTLSAESIVEADGLIYMWNEGGIYLLKSGQISDQLELTRITEDTIQTFYDEIGNAARAYVRGFYDDFTKKIHWFYNDSSTYDGITDRFDYNRSLNLDLTLNAWYPHTFATITGDSPIIGAMTQKSPGNETIVTYDIRHLLDDVTLNASADDIVQDVAFPTFADTKLKLLTFIKDETDPTSRRYTFSEFISREFRDWKIWDVLTNDVENLGADYTSVIQAGWQHFGDPLPIKKITHLVSYFNRTETGYTLVDGNVVFDFPSGGTVQTRWQWTEVDIGRWTKKEVAYRLLDRYIPDDETDPFDYGFEVIKTKLAMRGKGNAFGVRYESEAGKDMQLIGFGINVRAGTKV